MVISFHLMLFSTKRQLYSIQCWTEGPEVGKVAPSAQSMPWGVQQAFMGAEEEPGKDNVT